MTEPLVLIFTCISIVSIIVSCTVIVMQADRQDIKPLRALFDKYYYKDNTMYNHIVKHKVLFLRLCLVPLMLPIAVFLINQLGMGNLRIRMDVQSIFGCLFWVVLTWHFIISTKDKK